jgi:hypothetical protein
MYRPAVGHTQPPLRGVSGLLSGRGVKLTTFVQLMLSLRMSGAIRVLPYTPSWRARVKLHFFSVGLQFVGFTGCYILGHFCSLMEDTKTFVHPVLIVSLQLSKHLVRFVKFCM